MTTRLSFFLLFSLFLSVFARADWTQLQGDARRSGNAPGEVLKASMGLKAAVPLTDGIYAAPVVSDGVAYVIDGSGVVFAIDTRTFKVKWRFATKGGAGNCFLPLFGLQKGLQEIEGKAVDSAMPPAKVASVCSRLRR